MKREIKYYLIALVALVFLRCSQDKKRTDVKLIGDLGNISLVLPSAYDTIHDWVSSSDTKCLRKHYYRIQSRNYSLNEETGFFKSIPEEIRALTIKHSESVDCHFEDSPNARPDLILENYRDNMLAERESMPSNNLDTIFIREKFLYHLVDISRIYNTEPYYILYTALTYHKGSIIEFEFANRGIPVVKQDFTNEADKILETVIFE